MDSLCAQATEAIEQGYTILILSDRGVDADHAPIPSLLATAGVHHHLIRQGTRNRVGLVVESGEPREVAHFALLIGYGAGAVNPYLAYETLDQMLRQGRLGDSIDLHKAEKNYIKAVNKGLLKIASKMGISTIQSYRGAQIFEAVGLNEEMVNRYFARVPKAPRPVPRDIPKEPPQARERRAVVEDAVPLPAVVVAYHVTYDGHPDAYPLHVTSKILSDGQSARIPRELVYNKRIALTAFGSGNITEHPNLFYAVAIVQPGRTPAEAEKALIEEFEKLKREPVADAELQRSKNQWNRDYLFSRESVQDKAMHLAHAAVIHNDITTADGEFDIFMNVTKADVQRVAKAYFNDTNRVVIHILPKGAGSR